MPSVGSGIFAVGGEVAATVLGTGVSVASGVGAGSEQAMSAARVIRSGARASFSIAFSFRPRGAENYCIAIPPPR